MSTPLTLKNESFEFVSTTNTLRATGIFFVYRYVPFSGLLGYRSIYNNTDRNPFILRTYVVTFSLECMIRSIGRPRFRSTLYRYVRINMIPGTKYVRYTSYMYCCCWWYQDGKRTRARLQFLGVRRSLRADELMIFVSYI